MEPVLRAATAFLFMITAGMVVRWWASGEAYLPVALVYAFGVPSFIAVLLSVPDFRWAPIAAASAGAALGAGVDLAMWYNTSDSGEAVRWFAGPLWATLVFPVCCSAGAAARAFCALRVARRL